VPPNDELQRTSDGNAAGSPLNSVFGGPSAPGGTLAVQRRLIGAVPQGSERRGRTSHEHA
jgi:hypothetical protein